MCLIKCIWCNIDTTKNGRVPSKKSIPCASWTYSLIERLYPLLSKKKNSSTKNNKESFFCIEAWDSENPICNCYQWFGSSNTFGYILVQKVTKKSKSRHNSQAWWLKRIPIRKISNNVSFWEHYLYSIFVVVIFQEPSKNWFI